jgi:hypothetical protein
MSQQNAPVFPASADVVVIGARSAGAVIVRRFSTPASGSRLGLAALAAAAARSAGPAWSGTQRYDIP